METTLMQDPEAAAAILDNLLQEQMQMHDWPEKKTARLVVGP